MERSSPEMSHICERTRKGTQKGVFKQNLTHFMSIKGDISWHFRSLGVVRNGRIYFIIPMVLTMGLPGRRERSRWRGDFNFHHDFHRGAWYYFMMSTGDEPRRFGRFKERAFPLGGILISTTTPVMVMLNAVEMEFSGFVLYSTRRKRRRYMIWILLFRVGAVMILPDYRFHGNDGERDSAGI